MLAAAAIEKHERIAGPQAQHPRDVVGGLAVDRQPAAGRQRSADVHPGQSHVASSMPSRATSTMRSISSGVIT